jgi:hypothetical protein
LGPRFAARRKKEAVMSVLPVSGLVLAAAEGNALPVSSVVFPIIAAGVFALLGVVTWSYRDVANRHSNKTSGNAPHGSSH